ncbi:hypothetical protein P7C70_g664, partial [Phenoliferia sp. Uapishka_3]
MDPLYSQLPPPILTQGDNFGIYSQQPNDTIAEEPSPDVRHSESVLFVDSHEDPTSTRENHTLAVQTQPLFAGGVPPIGFGVDSHSSRVAEKQEQAKAIKDTPNDVLERQLDRKQTAEREKAGLAPIPTLIPGLNDSVVWTLRRRFDVQVVHVLSPAVKLPRGEPDLRPSTLSKVPFQGSVLKSNAERVFATLFFKAVPDPNIPVRALTPTAKTSFLLSVPDPALYQDKLQLLYDHAIEGGQLFQRFVVRVTAGGYTGSDPGNGEVGKKTEPDSQKVKDERRSGWEDERSRHPEGPAAEKLEELEAKEEEWGDEQRDELASQFAKVFQELLGQTADAIEILQNALSPPAPFPENNARHRLAAVLCPIVIMIPLIPAWFWSYAFGAIFGITFFGQPLLIAGAKNFVERVPNWREKLSVRESVFSGVPTNMQLMLHILRKKEAHFHPLPPPPDLLSDLDVLHELDSDSGTNISYSEVGIIVDEEEESIVLEEDRRKEEEEEEENTDGRGKRGIKSILKSAIKRVGGKSETLGKTRKMVGEKVDVRVYQSKAEDYGSNDMFPCKYQDTSGHLILKVFPDTPATIHFQPIESSAFTVDSTFPLEDLVELKKLGITAKRALLGKLAKMEMEGKGLEMRFKEAHERARDGYGSPPLIFKEDFEGQILTFDQIHRRDELFARLVSVPGAETRWETL